MPSHPILTKSSEGQCSLPCFITGLPLARAHMAKWLNEDLNPALSVKSCGKLEIGVHCRERQHCEELEEECLARRGGNVKGCSNI